MNWQPIARIILRYIAVPLGMWAGMSYNTVTGIAADVDVVFAVSGLLALAVEGWYAWAKRKGGAT